MKLETVNIVDLAPYEKNPRKNDNAVETVKKSIEQYGFLVPIILDDKNTIVAGHTRVKAAIKLGITELPCIYTEGLSEDQVKAFRVMDNKTSELAEWDYNLLKEEFHDLEDTDLFNYTGFSTEEITKIWDNELLTDSIPIASNKEHTFQHTCPECGHQFEETIKNKKERETL